MDSNIALCLPRVAPCHLIIPVNDAIQYQYIPIPDLSTMAGIVLFRIIKPHDISNPDRDVGIQRLQKGCDTLIAN